MSDIFKIESISQLHKILGCSPPLHPGISWIKFSDMDISLNSDTTTTLANFYVISLKTAAGKMRYGRNFYDFEEGSLIFTAPNQIVNPTHLAEDLLDQEGWSLFIHPELLYSSDLGNKMPNYSFFSYDTNEALHLSEKEKRKILESIQNIYDEYAQNMDNHSQELILSNLELLLNYCKRFYDRQFMTRKKQNIDVLTKIDNLLRNYFNSDQPVLSGLPTVKFCAEQMHLSANYLSDLLKKETGKSTKEHIDYFLLETAKKRLLNSTMNISEIAFELGFENGKSLGKLFKKKLGITPNQFRKNLG